MAQDWQLEVIERLTRIEEKVTPVPAIIERVDSLESSRDRAKGVMWTLSVVWGALTALFTWHVWRGR